MESEPKHGYHWPRPLTGWLLIGPNGIVTIQLGTNNVLIKKWLMVSIWNIRPLLPLNFKFLATIYMHLLTTFVNVLVLTDSWMTAVPQV